MVLIKDTTHDTFRPPDPAQGGDWALDHRAAAPSCASAFLSRRLDLPELRRGAARALGDGLHKGGRCHPAATFLVAALPKKNYYSAMPRSQWQALDLV